MVDLSRLHVDLKLEVSLNDLKCLLTSRYVWYSLHIDLKCLLEVDLRTSNSVKRLASKSSKIDLKCLEVCLNIMTSNVC